MIVTVQPVLSTTEHDQKQNKTKQIRVFVVIRTNIKLGG